MITNVLVRQFDLGVKGQGQMYMKSGCRPMDFNANSSYIYDGGCFYLTHCLPEVCRWQKFDSRRDL